MQQDQLRSTKLYNEPAVRMPKERREKTRRREDATCNLKNIGLALYDAANVGGELFTCPICRRILTAPVTADCGHTFCVDCLDKVNLKCVVCAADVGTMRATNVLVQDIVSKWREIHTNEELDATIPETADILGIEPRYCLRSRNAGLQSRLEGEENNINKIVRRLIIPKRKAKSKYDSWCRIRSRSLLPSTLLKENCSYREISRREISKVVKNVESIRDKYLRESWQHIAVADLECILCSRCLLNPVTTRCGHTFCRGCLARVIDHRLACPLCMSPLSPFEESRGTTGVIEDAIKFLMPCDYKHRLVASKEEIKNLEKDCKIPVFVCTNAFPGVACPLYVYEPRYRLLARRCLQSRSRRFAMAARVDTSQKFAPFGTILEVRDAVQLHDGTSILTTVGVRRFRVINKGEQDGYDTATVQYIKDNTVSPERLPELLALHQKVYNRAAKWVSSLTPRVLAEVENCIGQMPKLEEGWHNLPDGPAWAWWLMPILPLTPKLQMSFIFTIDLERRLRAIDKMFEHMNIKMRALKRSTLKCADTVENSDSCWLSRLL